MWTAKRKKGLQAKARADLYSPTPAMGGYGWVYPSPSYVPPVLPFYPQS